MMVLLISSELLSASEAISKRFWPIERAATWKAIARAVNWKREAGSTDFESLDFESLDFEILDFEILGDPVSRQPHSALQVESSHWNAPQAAVEFRLRCVERKQCGAFLVRVRWPPPELRRLGRASFHHAQAGTGLRSAAPALARQGRPARMAWQGDGFRLWVPVMCMQTGALGDRIRVRDRQAGKHFLARVTGLAELEAVSE